MIFLTPLFFATTSLVSGQENSEVLPPPEIDGVIESNEYEFGITLGANDFELFWQVENDSIAFGMRAKTDGWLAIGIDPSSVMKDADMFVGYVGDDGTAVLYDCYATGKTGPHPPDTELGGTSDILEYNGTFDGDWTTFEFSRKLATGDRYDNVVHTDGDTKVLWAYGSTDDKSIKHMQRGGVIVDLSSGAASEYVPWYYHAGWMTAGFSLMLIGIIIIRYLKKKTWRIKVHKSMLILGGASSILGLGSGIFMVTVNGSGHFDILHAYIGIITIILILITIRLGFRQFQVKPDKIKKFKAYHRWCGRITATMMIINILFGLSYVGII